MCLVTGEAVLFTYAVDLMNGMLFHCLLIAEPVVMPHARTSRVMLSVCDYLGAVITGVFFADSKLGQHNTTVSVSHGRPVRCVCDILGAMISVSSLRAPCWASTELRLFVSEEVKYDAVVFVLCMGAFFQTSCCLRGSRSICARSS